MFQKDWVLDSMGISGDYFSLLFDSF